MMIGHFLEGCKRSCRNADKSEEGRACKVSVDVLEFEYLGFVLDESGTERIECCSKVASGRRVVGVLEHLRMLGIFNVNVQGYCMRDCLYLF